MIDPVQKYPNLDLLPVFFSRFSVRSRRDFWALLGWMLYFPSAIDEYIYQSATNFSGRRASGEVLNSEVNSGQIDLDEGPASRSLHHPELFLLSFAIGLLSLLVFSLLFWGASFFFRYGLLSLFGEFQRHIEPLSAYIAISFLVSAIVLLCIAIAVLYLNVRGRTHLGYKAFIKNSLWISLTLSLFVAWILAAGTALWYEFAVLSGLIAGGVLGGAARLTLLPLHLEKDDSLRVVAQLFLFLSLFMSVLLLILFWMNTERDVVGIAVLLLLALVIAVCAAGLVVLRPDDWWLAWNRCEDEPDEQGHWQVPHVTTAPFPRVLSELKQVLDEEWEQGLQYTLALETYTFQQPYITHMIRQILKGATEAQVVERVYELHLRPAFQSRIRDYAPKSNKPFVLHERKRPALNVWQLSNEKKKNKFFVRPEPLRVNLATDTSARAVVAAFYSLERLHVDKALEALKGCSLHEAKRGGVLGAELCDLLSFILMLSNDNIRDLAPMSLPEPPTKSKFQTAWNTLEDFQVFVRCFWVYTHCRKHDNRQRMAELCIHHLGEVARVLYHFKTEKMQEDGLSTDQYKSTYPIEYLLWRRASTWRLDLKKDQKSQKRNHENSTKADSDQEGTFKPSEPKPIDNPFNFVEPLRDSRLLSMRDELLQKFKKAWKPGNFQPILLYGQRQIGKTSVIFSAARDKSIYADILVAYVNLQHLGINATHAEMLRTICDEIHLHYQYVAPPNFDELVKAPYHIFQLYIRNYCLALREQGLVVVLDEFDHIGSIANFSGTEDNFLSYLWELSQSESKLGFVFVTPRTPGEIQSDYSNPFATGLSPIRVSYIDKSHTQEILRRPTDDFLPYFHQEAIDYIVDLTGGHPYLVQIIAYCILERYNDQIEKATVESTKAFPDPLFLAADIRQVMADDANFKGRSLRYFENVLREVVDDDLECQKLLRRLACHQDGFSETDLKTMPVTLGYLAKLTEHDVVEQNPTNKRFRIHVGLLQDKIQYPITQIRTLEQEQLFQAYKRQPSSALQYRIYPKDTLHFILCDSDVYETIRGHTSDTKDVLARCSVWKKNSSSSSCTPLVSFLGNLACEDKAVATQLTNYAFEQSNLTKEREVIAPVEPLTFWQLYFGDFVTETLPPTYWRQTKFRDIDRSYESLTSELAQAIATLSQLPPISEPSDDNSDFEFCALDVDNPRDGLSQIHSLVTDIHTEDPNQVQNAQRDELIYFPLEFSEFEELYGPLLTHSRHNFVTLVKKRPAEKQFSTTEDDTAVQYSEEDNAEWKESKSQKTMAPGPSKQDSTEESTEELNDIVGFIIAFDAQNVDDEVAETENTLLVKMVAVRSEYQNTSLFDELLYQCYQRAKANNFTQVRHDFVRNGDKSLAYEQLRGVAQSRVNYKLYRALP
ncbi:MAG: AAA-like domain-containing protein [Chloroflexota bacterium]